MTEQQGDCVRAETKNIGLRGVTVADTRISAVDGDKGRLIYRGFAIEDIARNASFEEVVYLLVMGRLPTAPELKAWIEALNESYELPNEVLLYLRSRVKGARPMDVLQGAVTVLADHDPDTGAIGREAMVRASLRLIARTMTVVTSWHHLRSGREPAVLDTRGSFARAFLKTLWSRNPTADEEKLMDVLLVLHAEHSLNASTFAAREVASTQAHLYASVSAAVGALSGALHGGANARVMQMLQQIGEKTKVEEWVKARLAAGERVMGFGHAVYKTIDPRAAILRTVAEKVLKGRADERWFDLALRVEEVTTRALREQKNLTLYPNVDFFSSPVLYSIGIPTDMFPAFFAVARTAGWCAHVIEETFAEAQGKPALYRPDAYYTGRDCGVQGCRWTPIEQRGAGCPSGHEFKGCNEAAGE